jgi:2-polyprenyl-6-methoxyphenol hydroxylase-like FAD-dependent oxidoreductase
MDTDAIVIGAGPAGLMLATELGLAGVPTVPLEALPTSSSQSKGGGLQPRTCEVLELRGLLAPVLEHALPREPVGGHFAALPVELGCRPWHTRHPYPVSVPQAAVQAVLAEVAGRRGVAVRSGHRVTAVHQDADGVVVTACTGDGGGEFRATARYAVACDGAHSTVRRLLDAPFPGESGTRTSTVADLRLTPGPAATPARDGHMSSLVHTGGGYWTMLSRADGGRHRLVYGTLDPTAGPARDAPVTPAEVADVLRAVHGPARLGELFETSRFADATRQLASYRHGRVLFAGDAAHVHPPLVPDPQAGQHSGPVREDRARARQNVRTARSTGCPAAAEQRTDQPDQRLQQPRRARPTRAAGGGLPAAATAEGDEVGRGLRLLRGGGRVRARLAGGELGRPGRGLVADQPATARHARLGTHRRPVLVVVGVRAERQEPDQQREGGGSNCRDRTERPNHDLLHSCGASYRG